MFEFRSIDIVYCDALQVIMTLNKGKTKRRFLKMSDSQKNEVLMLENLYKNTKMGADSAIKIIDKAEGADFKRALTEQLCGYDEFAERIKERLHKIGYKEKDESIMARMGVSIGMAMNTMMDSSDSHLAQMVVEGSTMGITDTLKILRDYENSSVSECAIKIARDIVSFEEKNVEKMKKFI